MSTIYSSTEDTVDHSHKEDGHHNEAFENTEPTEPFEPHSKHVHLQEEEKHNKEDEAGSMHTVRSGPDEDGEDRQQWSSPIEFLLSCIAMSVGLGNVWRWVKSRIPRYGESLVKSRKSSIFLLCLRGV